VNAGDVVRVHTTLTAPPKDKIVLCVGVHFGNELFLWFNTDARQRPGQMAVMRDEAPGISHDCFLDCGRVTTFPAHELVSAQYCGRAQGAFLMRVADEVATRATTLTNGQRRSIPDMLRYTAGKAWP
jgi:hypothetical protein